MDRNEITSFLIHHLLPAFPVAAEACWEVFPGTESGGDGQDGARRAVSISKSRDGLTRKKRKVSLGDSRTAKSAPVLGENQRWWGFLMLDVCYEDGASTSAGNRAVVSVQYSDVIGTEENGLHGRNGSQGYSGAKADVVFIMKTTGSQRGFWMQDSDTGENRVRVRLVNKNLEPQVVPASLGESESESNLGNDLVIAKHGTHADDEDETALYVHQGNALLPEEFLKLRGRLDRLTDSAGPSITIRNDLKSRLGGFAVHRLLEHFSLSKPPASMVKEYKLQKCATSVDGSDACGNSSVEMYLTDATYEEFQQISAMAMSSFGSHGCARAYLSPSAQSVACYNPMAPCTMSIVYSFLSDFFDLIGMSLTQRILEVYRPPRRESSVTCVLGSTELFRVSGNASGHLQRDVVLGVCRHTLQKLLSLHPELPNFNVEVLHLGNSSLHAETMVTENAFELLNGTVQDIAMESRDNGITETGRSNGFRLKWTPLGWNSKKRTADSGVYGTVSASLNVAFMRDKNLGDSCLSFLNTESSELSSSGSDQSTRSRADMTKILCTPEAN